MTTIHPTFHQAAAMGHATGPAHAAPGPSAPPPARVQATHEFHDQRVGVQQLMPRLMSQLTPQPMPQPMPHLTQQPMPRPAPRPAAPGSSGAARNRPASASQAAPRLEGTLAEMLAWVDDGGDLAHFMRESGHDPLEQYNLLQALANERESARAAAEALCAGLEQDHGAALSDARQGQARCAAALDELGQQDPEAAAREHEHERALMWRFQQRLSRGAEPGGATLADDALALAADFKAVGAGALVERLARLRRHVGAEPALRRAGMHRARLWMSLRQASSFLLLESCLRQGAQLHARLVPGGWLAPGRRADEVGIGLLAAGNLSHGPELAEQTGVRAGQQASRAYQLLADAVRALPLALWSSLEARRTLLASLDGAALAAPRHGSEARLEHDLRTRLETHDA